MISLLTAYDSNRLHITQKLLAHWGSFEVPFVGLAECFALQGPFDDEPLLSTCIVEGTTVLDRVRRQRRVLGPMIHWLLQQFHANRCDESWEDEPMHHIFMQHDSSLKQH
jgi:hypothetical protein